MSNIYIYIYIYICICIYNIYFNNRLGSGFSVRFWPKTENRDCYKDRYPP